MYSIKDIKRFFFKQIKCQRQCFIIFICFRQFKHLHADCISIQIDLFMPKRWFQIFFV